MNLRRLLAPSAILALASVSLALWLGGLYVEKIEGPYVEKKHARLYPREDECAALAGYAKDFALARDRGLSQSELLASVYAFSRNSREIDQEALVQLVDQVCNRFRGMTPLMVHDFVYGSCLNGNT